MTPRPDIVGVEVNSGIDGIKQAIEESGHSRIPVFEASLDNIVGVVYAKDLLKFRRDTLREYMRQVIFIPETKKIADLMREMQSARSHFAVIVDEYGVTSGVVTLEDLLEEIVGEIHDEFERDERSIEKIDANTSLIDGKLAIADLNDQLNLSLPQGDYDTIGGMVFNLLGKAPCVGNAVRFENMLLSVERVHRRRITRIKMVKLPDSGDEGVGG
jgi:CBS domain containing-hemolysin-like protein